MSGLWLLWMAGHGIAKAVAVHGWTPVIVGLVLFLIFKPLFSGD